MTPTDLIRQKLIHMTTGEVVGTPEAVRERYAALQEDEEKQDWLTDNEAGLRQGQERTGLPCGYSRHYSSAAVAAEMLDGSWVGWTYFYGGGKHGQPSEMPWMEDAYRVAWSEETVVVKKFRVVEGQVDDRDGG